MSERFNWEVMGRVVGTASGWDQADTFEMVLYDFVPLEGLPLPRGDFVNFNFETGLVSKYDDTGKPTDVVDFVEAVAHLENLNL